MCQVDSTRSIYLAGFTYARLDLKQNNLGQTERRRFVSPAGVSARVRGSHAARVNSLYYIKLEFNVIIMLSFTEP